MNLNTRLQRLEQQVPSEPEPKPDLSAVSIDELHFALRHLGTPTDKPIVYDDLTPEERESRFHAIWEKIVWR